MILTRKQIADKIGLSVRTLSGYIYRNVVHSQERHSRVGNNVYYEITQSQIDDMKESINRWNDELKKNGKHRRSGYNVKCKENGREYIKMLEDMMRENEGPVTVMDRLNGISKY